MEHQHYKEKIPSVKEMSKDNTHFLITQQRKYAKFKYATRESSMLMIIKEEEWCH